jgi:hypothetical protein
MRTGESRAGAMILITAGLALLLSGCLWGVVQDAQTGQRIPGAQVTFYDAVGNSGTTTTNPDGLYAFDAAETTLPAVGPVAFHVSAAGYQTLSSQRDVQYDDTADGASEIQSFSLAAAVPAPPGGG